MGSLDQPEHDVHLPLPPSISLGGSIWGAPPATGCVAYGPRNAPQPWVCSFVAVQDGCQRINLFRSGRAGRDLILLTSPKATLQLDLAHQEPTAFLKALKRSQQLLRKRHLPTGLTLQLNHTPQCKVSLECLYVCLGPAEQHITELTLCSTGCKGPDINTVTVFLKNISSVLHNITHIELNACPGLIPPPSALPSLTTLILAEPNPAGHTHAPLNADVIDSVAAYLTQLTSLTVLLNDPSMWSAAAELLFTAPTHTLTHLRVDTYLTDDLLDLLLDHAPEITHLEVQGVDLGSDGYRERTWAVERLCLRSMGCIPSLQRIVRVPRGRRDGGVRMLVQGSNGLDLTVTEQGIEPAIHSRLHEWCFDIQECSLKPELDMVSEDHPRALRRVLEQLRELEAPGATIRMQGWHWSLELSQIISLALPTLTHLSFGVATSGALTDDTLTAVLAMGPGIRSLNVYSLDLSSDQHATRTCPWRELTIACADVSTLVRLPRPCGDKPLRVQPIYEVVLDSKVVEVGVDRLKQCLQHMEWEHKVGRPRFQLRHTSPTPTATPSPTTLTTTSQPPTPQETSSAADSLRAQLSVLVAIRLNPPEAQNRAVVKLVGFPLVPEVVETLTGVPTWGCTLDLCECVYAVSEEETRGLVDRYVPKGVSVVLKGA